MMQSLIGAADDWSLASESRYDRRRATDLGNFAPRLTAGVMEEIVFEICWFPVSFFVGFVLSLSFFCHIYMFVIHARLCFLICPGNLVSLKGSSNRCRWFSGFVWQAWHMSCRLLLWNHGTRTERWMLKCPSAGWVESVEQFAPPQINHRR